jgi:hypothetical protein
MERTSDFGKLQFLYKTRGQRPRQEHQYAAGAGGSGDNF